MEISKKYKGDKLFMKIPCKDCLVLVRCRERTRYSYSPIGILKVECIFLEKYCDKHESGPPYSEELRKILYHNNPLIPKIHGGGNERNTV